MALVWNFISVNLKDFIKENSLSCLHNISYLVKRIIKKRYFWYNVYVVLLLILDKQNYVIKY